MKFLTAIAFIFLCALTGYSQATSQNARRIISGTAVPNAACNPGPPYRDVYIRTGTGAIYECTAAPSTWTLVVAGGAPASGTVTSVSGTANQIGVASPTTTPTLTLSSTLVTPGTLTVTGLTSGRVPILGTSGLLTDNAALTFSGNTLSVGVASTTTGSFRLLNSASAFATTFRAGNNVAARTYTWPTDLGAAGATLTDAAGNGTLSWTVPTTGLTVGTTAITSGTANRVLFEGAGNVVSEDADLTFLTDTLTFTKGVASTNLAVGGCTIGTDGLCVTGTTTHNGNFTVNGAAIILSGNISGSAIFGTGGIRIKGVAATFNDTTSSGTVAAAYTDALGGNTLTATGATTITDYNTVNIQPATASTNVTITRKHSLGILDSTSAASSTTGGFVNCATYGTAATCVGIGGGNINAGGTLTVGGTLTGVDAVFTPAPTTGNGFAINSSTVTTGNTVSITASGTAAASNTKTALNVATSGANATSAMTTYGAQIANTSTGTTSVNYGVLAQATGGATTNIPFLAKSSSTFNSSGLGAGFVAQDATTATKQLLMGVDGANNVAFILSAQSGTANRPLLLNSVGTAAASGVGIGTGNTAVAALFDVAGKFLVDASGNTTLATAAKLSMTSGTNTRAGNAVLVGGTVTVSNTTVTANTIVLLTRKTSGGTIGTSIQYTLSAGSSFTITSDNILDTSTFSYVLIENP